MKIIVDGKTYTRGSDGRFSLVTDTSERLDVKRLAVRPSWKTRITNLFKRGNKNAD